MIGGIVFLLSDNSCYSTCSLLILNDSTLGAPMSPLHPNTGRAWWLLLMGAALVSMLAVGGAWFFSPNRIPAAQRLAEAKLAAAEKDFRSAEALAAGISLDDPLFAESRLAAGEYATRGERYEEAIGYYREIPLDDSDQSFDGAYALAEVCRHVGYLEEAERNYLRVLEHWPEYFEVRSRLVFLLGATGQRWEATPHYFKLLRQGNWSLDELTMLADLERPHQQQEYLRQCEQNVPGDLLVQLGLAANDLIDRRDEVAKRRLDAVLARDPHRLSAQAMRGESLAREDDAAYSVWLAQLPDGAERHPGIWLVRGRRYRNLKNFEAAARCFWEALRLDSRSREACYQLGQALVALDRDEGQQFIARADALFQLRQSLNDVRQTEEPSERAMRRVTEILRDTGRHWEAWAWAFTAQRAFPRARWPGEIVAELGPTLDASVPVTVAASDLSRTIDLSEIELPAPGVGRQSNSSGDVAVVDLGDAIRFDDEAEQRGIGFVYFNGDEDPSKPGARMFEPNGGAVAVLDFDRDALPDLFFSQGSLWPEGSHVPVRSPEYVNRCFRNTGTGFADVTQRADLADEGYGQGAAVGDFDNDGFSDLYVANIGGNKLYRNNGDGTFSDVSGEAGLRHSEWTASCLIADLNADGHPDLFDVNYLVGKNIYTMRCEEMACSPGIYKGAQDRLFISRGDGTFSHVPDATPTENAKGLGVVAVSLGTPERLSLFVANDKVPNHFLVNTASSEWPGVRLVDESLLRGTAYDETGSPTACMGIALGDADGNGLFDLFVTNFADETNTLYLQDRSGMFVDATKISGLASPSFPYVGWGTQFIDAQLDGWPDLIVVNGHVDDYGHKNSFYHMPAQFFVNAGAGRFSELDTRRAGSFFGRHYLGRGLSRLDWNRDGLMDFAVCNINSPAALATNRSTTAGHYFNLRLTATRTARDAIGAVVQLKAGRRTWTQHLIAGDGYMASNERMLSFGLGAASRVDELIVTWPSGDTLTLTNLPVDVVLDIVEGSERGTLWRGHAPESFAAREIPVPS